MNKVIDKGFRSCRFVSTIVKHPVCYLYVFENKTRWVPNVTQDATPIGWHRNVFLIQ